jgi:hypothetical protein
MSSVDQQQLLALLNLLAQYNAGVVDQRGSGGFGTSNGQSTNQGGNVSMGLSNAAVAANLAAVIGQDQTMGQMSGLLGLASALSNPNASVQSVAPAALGALGFGQLASIANIANNGLNTSSVLGLLGATVNPAFGLLGLANSLAGDPFSDSLTGLGETLGNPDSMATLSDIGISFGDQLGNAADQGQIGQDQEGFEGLIGALSGFNDSTEGTTAADSADSGNSGDNGDSGDY